MRTEDELVDLGKEMTMTEAGRKNDRGKARWDLVPWPALEQVVHVLTHAVTSGTYSDDNWIRVPDARRRYWAALQRHMTNWHLGDRVDAVSGLPHLAHSACCVLFLLALDMGVESSEPGRMDTDMPPPLSDEWDPTGAKPPPVDLPDGMRWQRGSTNYWTVEGDDGDDGLTVGFVFLSYDERSWFSHVLQKDGDGSITHASALEACQAVATQLASHGAPPPPSDEWDPAGEDPPPVALPDGMRWSRDGCEWVVQDQDNSFEIIGYVALAENRVSRMNGVWFSHVLLDGQSIPYTSALEACQALATQLTAQDTTPPEEAADEAAWNLRSQALVMTAVEAAARYVRGLSDDCIEALECEIGVRDAIRQALQEKS